MSYICLKILANEKTVDQMSRTVPSCQRLRFRDMYYAARREYDASPERDQFDTSVFSKWEQLLSIPEKERLNLK